MRRAFQISAHRGRRRLSPPLSALRLWLDRRYALEVHPEPAQLVIGQRTDRLPRHVLVAKLPPGWRGTRAHGADEVLLAPFAELRRGGEVGRRWSACLAPHGLTREILPMTELARDAQELPVLERRPRRGPGNPRRVIDDA